MITAIVWLVALAFTPDEKGFGRSANNFLIFVAAVLATIVINR